MTVTQQDVDAEMQNVMVRTVKEFGRSVTYVTVRMRNGFTIRESTQPVDEDNYDEEIGKKICLEHIADKIWFLLGYMLCEDNFRKKDTAHGLMNANPVAGCEHEDMELQNTYIRQLKAELKEKDRALAKSYVRYIEDYALPWFICDNCTDDETGYSASCVDCHEHCHLYNFLQKCKSFYRSARGFAIPTDEGIIWRGKRDRK